MPSSSHAAQPAAPPQILNQKREIQSRFVAVQQPGNSLSVAKQTADDVSVKWLHSLTASDSRTPDAHHQAVRTASQQLHASLRAAFLNQRIAMISALKLGRAVSMFAAFHFILSGLAVLFGDWASAAGICAAAGYAGARMFHGWLLLLYAVWLVADTAIELTTVLQDADTTVQSRVLLIIFQLLVYGAAFTLVVRLVRLLRRLETLSTEADTLLQRQRQQLMEQLQTLAAAVSSPREQPRPMPPAPAFGASCASHTPGQGAGGGAPSANAAIRMNKSEAVDVWPECPPKDVSGALALCLQVQRQLEAVWGPRAATLRNLHGHATALSGSSASGAVSVGRAVVLVQGGARRVVPSQAGTDAEAFARSQPQQGGQLRTPSAGEYPRPQRHRAAGGGPPAAMAWG